MKFQQRLLIKHSFRSNKTRICGLPLRDTKLEDRNQDSYNYMPTYVQKSTAKKGREKKALEKKLNNENNNNNNLLHC